MAKYLAVYKKGKEDVRSRFYKQLIDGVVAVNQLFDGEAKEAETDRAAFNVEKVSLVLELHSDETDAFLFRVPQFASKKLIFEADGPSLKYIGAKPQQPSRSGIHAIWQTGQHIFVTF